MFGNFSLFELLVVGAIALIVIGPKDLPKMMRSIGKFMGQARGLARQFQDSMNEAAREADLQELNEARKMLSSKSPTTALTNTLNKTLDLDDDTEAKRSPVMSSDEMEALANEAGFGSGASKSAPDSEASPSPDSQAADVAAVDDAAPDAKAG